MYKYIDSTVFITENEMPIDIDINLRKLLELGQGKQKVLPLPDFGGGKTIADFKAQINKGFSRPNLFQVDMAPVGADKATQYRMNCFQAQIPGSNLATTEKDIGFRSVAYQKIFGDVILGFYVDTELHQLQFFQDWIDFIVSPNNNHFNYPNLYQSQIKITSVNRLGSPAGQWVLHDAYPKQVDPISLDYGTNDTIMTANITLSYRHYTHHYKNFQSHTSIAADVSDRMSSDFQQIGSTLKNSISSMSDKFANEQKHFFEKYAGRGKEFMNKFMQKGDRGPLGGLSNMMSKLPDSVEV